MQVTADLEPRKATPSRSGAAAAALIAGVDVAIAITKLTEGPVLSEACSKNSIQCAHTELGRIQIVKQATAIIHEVVARPPRAGRA